MLFGSVGVVFATEDKLPLNLDALVVQRSEHVPEVSSLTTQPRTRLLTGPKYLALPGLDHPRLGHANRSFSRSRGGRTRDVQLVRVEEDTSGAPGKRPARPMMAMLSASVSASMAL
jgi:hypothetical protein